MSICFLVSSCNSNAKPCPSLQDRPTQIFLPWCPTVPPLIPVHCSLIIHSSLMVIFCSSKKSNVLFHRDFNCANTSVRIFFFCFSKLLACPLFSDCSLNSFSSVVTFLNQLPPPTPPPPHTSHSLYITLFYLVALILLEIILFICFILYCLLHHPSYLSFILEYKFNESTDDRNLFFF